MTQVSQDQPPQTEDVSNETPTPQETTINKIPNHQVEMKDSPSDNDANEKSAREKFKKTSIASLYKHTIPPDTVLHGEDASATEGSQQIASKSDDVSGEFSRGRLPGKRGLEDEEISLVDQAANVESEPPPDSPNGHTRKRSRDVRAGEHVKGTGRSYDLNEEPVQEEPEDFAESQKHTMLLEHPRDHSVIHEGQDHELSGDGNNLKPEGVDGRLDPSHVLPSEGSALSQNLNAEEKRKSEDEEMRDGAYSPRKKRSRDQLDAVVDREQKIAATEEARAQRRSEELDRTDIFLHRGASVTNENSSNASSLGVTTGVLDKSKEDGARPKISKATFGATNALHPPSGSSTLRSIRKASDDGHTESETVSAPTQSAFASSGFANFASAPGSPFGAVVSSSTSKEPVLSGFAKASAQVVDTEKVDSKTGSGFGSFSKVQPADFGKTKMSPFASAGSTAGTTFGGTQMGGSFGSGFVGGGRLTSFAAPTGDAKLGNANGSAKPTALTGNDNDDRDGSGTEDEGDEEDNKNGDSSETDDRFQHQEVDTGEDGEDTVFSSRAKLYAFRENNWKEAGSGIFKLNVIVSNDPEEAQRNSRFIMRAHQTYRVLLNQPAFPQMKMGDQLGSEPTGKTFAFAVIVDNKPIPHMVKFGDVNESKRLYHEVLRLGVVQEKQAQLPDSKPDISQEVHST